MALETTTVEPFNKRALLLRDGLTFLILTLTTLALYGVTTFLFHSFESHREDLGQRWSQRGQQAIQQGRPTEAITALRAALTYAPDDQSYQLLLAQALADAGRTDEATAYYQTFWDARPGDGNINLQLARLYRQTKNTNKAINFYRASIFGAWQGDAITRRREVRLELTSYLIEQQDYLNARTELLIIAGNAPDNASLDMNLAEMFETVGDIENAAIFYDRASAQLEPKRRR
jgi:Tfp pilus assembly protein PilF